MTILVVGGTSAVGNHLLQLLLERGQTVRSTTHVADNMKSLPAGVQGCIADLEKPATLRMAMDGVAKLFLTTPLHPQESKMGLAAVKAATQCGVEKIVYMSERIFKETEHIPHFKRKIAVEQAIMDSGMEYTLLRPNNFYQNDFWCEAAIMLYNVYPQPLGNKGVQRLDARDVSVAGANALLDDSHNGEIYNLYGPQVLTGESIAQTFSDALGKQVYYSGDDLDNWARQARHMMPDWMVQEFKIMYQHFQEDGAIATDEEMQKQSALLPQTTPFRQFVDEIIPKWKQEHGG